MGAHFPFHDDLPTWGMDADADVVVTSVHKMGGAVEQSSVFHLQGDRVDPDVLKQREDLLGTTSASSLVYGSLDAWRRQMVESGTELLGSAISRAHGAREAISQISGLLLMGEEVVEQGYAREIDPLVLTIDVRELGITGYQAAEWARTEKHVDFGAADSCRFSARLTHADDDEHVELLLRTLRDLVPAAQGLESKPPVDFPTADALQLETAMRPRDAFFGRTEDVPLAGAVGRVAAEMVSPYPPGVPIGASRPQPALQWSGGPSGRSHRDPVAMLCS
jgi:arginine decarboxylase